MAVDQLADLDIAKLEGAGIPARRIPPTNVGALVPANVRIRICVPRDQEQEAKALLGEQTGRAPEPAPEKPDDTTDEPGSRTGRIVKWIVIAGAAIYIVAQLLWILTSQTR